MSAQRTPAQAAAAPRHASTASGRIANQILEELTDLAPSVHTAAAASVYERSQLNAIDAFGASLATRPASTDEPSNAIATGGPVEGADSRVARGLR